VINSRGAERKVVQMRWGDNESPDGELDPVGEVGASASHAEMGRRYVDELIGAIGNLDTAVLGGLITRIIETIRGRRTVFLAGNGGSSSAASHMASDWSTAAVAAFGGPVTVTCLTDNTPRLTALANDASYVEALARLVESNSRPGDLLVLLSVSGSSPNLVQAAKTAQTADVSVLALVGHAGPLVNHCDAWLEFGEGDYGLVEDLHIAVNHIVVRALHGGVPQVFRPDRASQWPGERLLPPTPRRGVLS
jgi:D-sedoheptulose 7-phosphate isomerase